MAKQLFANNARSTLASGINASVTELTVATGEGALFPAVTGGDWFLATLALRPVGVTETAWEVVKVTGVSDDTFTVERAQEGTTALSWASGTLIELRATAGTLEGLQTPAATESVLGSVELATSTEAVAGTSGAVVPAVDTLRQAFTSWLRDEAGKYAGVIQPAVAFHAPDLALPAWMTFSRSSSAWRTNQVPAVVEATTNAARFDFSADGSLRGLLIEGSTTRMNTIAAAPTAAEAVTVTAAPHTISFYGTGSVVLTGAHSATLTGTGAYPARVSLTFTPSAGTLTMTPSGTVQHLQLEANPFASSPILGEGTTPARAQDVVGTSVSALDFNTSEGAVVVTAFTAPGVGSAEQRLFQIDSGSTSNRIYASRFYTDSIIRASVVSGGTSQASLKLDVVADNTRFRLGFSWAANDFRAVLNGGAAVSDVSGVIPTGLTMFRIGRDTTTLSWWGTLVQLAYFPRALTTAQLQALTL